jgi:hypothetical protein
MPDIRVFALQNMEITNDASTSLPENSSIKHDAATPGLAEHAPMSTAKEVLEALSRSKKGSLDFLHAIQKTLTLDFSPVEQVECGPGMILDLAKEELAATALLDLFVLAQWLIKYLLSRDTPSGGDPDGLAWQLHEKTSDMRAEVLHLGAAAILEGVAMLESQSIGDTAPAAADGDACASSAAGLGHRLTGKISLVSMKLKGHRTRLYLSTSPKPPLFLSLLNGLTLSCKLPKIVEDADHWTAECMVSSKATNPTGGLA